MLHGGASGRMLAVLTGGEASVLSPFDHLSKAAAVHARSLTVGLDGLPPQVQPTGHAEEREGTQAGEPAAKPKRGRRS